MSKKKNQKVNSEIPISVWDDFEDLYTMEKRKDSSRKLLKKDFFIMIIQNGVQTWKK